MSEIGLGRRFAFDKRDRDHALTAAPSARQSRIWYAGAPLDQGSTSQCVAYAGVKYLQCAPVMNKPPFKPVDIYRECLKVDEFPGDDMNGGTSVRALFKVLKERGYIDAYKWAFDAETVIDHVLEVGPVVLGTIWTRDMFMPHNKTGFIEPTGDVDGGHGWCLIGANRKRRAGRLLNSWGPRWGENGRAWVSFDSLDYLIKQDGEACVATEVLVK